MVTGLFATLVLCGPAAADEAKPYLGLQLMYIDFQKGLSGSGAGFAILGGYAGGGPLSAPLQLGYGSSKNYIVNPGLDYAFWRPGPNRIYLHGGYGWYGDEVKYSFGDVGLRGRGPDVGLGVDHEANPRGTMGLGVVCRFIRFNQSDDARISGDVNARRIEVYFRWKWFLNRQSAASDAPVKPSEP